MFTVYKPCLILMIFRRFVHINQSRTAPVQPEETSLAYLER